MMKNKIFNKKRNIIVAIIAVTMLIGASIANTVYAVGGWEKVTRLKETVVETVTEAAKNSKIIGSEDTAIKKLWYKSLSSCLENNNFGGWKGHHETLLNPNSSYLIRPEEFRGLDWFTTKDFMNWIPKVLDYNTVVSGPYIEYMVTGKYDAGGGDSGNDEIRCGEDDDSLVKRGLPQLGLEAIDVACNPNDDYLTNGIADVNTNETACSAAYSGSNDWHLNEDGKARGRYFKNLVKEKTFGGEVPGGSLDEATDLEMYYIMRESFNIACVQGSLVFGDNNLGKIVAFNEKTEKFEEAGYSVNGKNGSDYEVDSPYIGTKTCAQLASDLGKDSKYTKAFLEEQFSDVKSGCKKEFDSEMKKIKDYRDQYKTITDAGASFASVIRRLVNDLGNGKVSTSVAGGQTLTPPLANAYIEYIKSKSSEASAKINGSPVYAESIINQLVTATEEVLSSSVINDDGTVVELGMNDGSRAQIDLLLGQMDKKVATCQSNLSTINNFITQNEGGGSGGIGGMYAYDNSGMNIVCSAKNVLKQQWDNIKESLNLTGAPDINDDFSSGGYIEIKDDTDAQDSDQKECYDGSGALGWILCPIIYGLSGVGQHMWNEIETNHMQISTTIFSGAGDTSSVKVGWDIMLNIANTIFIILFLVVIFSQLTGVGIDNYGIKKILPKLIVVAILINLSYIICQIAVDLSNILGVGLNDLMSSGANNVVKTTSEDIAAEVDRETGMAQSMSTGGFLTAGATLASIGLVFGWFSSGGGIRATAAWIGIAVLGIVIVVVVAMLFLYLILIAREAGIVMAIVLAPVAIVCYALPNTEKFSKKWFSLFKSLLLVYPICGAMIGAGKFAGAILANSGDGGMKIAAMIVQVVPYFLVPLVLKNSLALMGNVGAKLSTLGRNLGRRGSRGATGAIRDSDRYKNFQQYNKEQRQARRAEAIRSRLQGRIDRGGRLSARNQNRLRQSQDIVLARNKRTREDAARSSGVHFDAMEAAMEDELRMQQGKERTTLMMNDPEYSSMGQDQMIARWNEIFDNQGGKYDGREEERLADLDALTNVITRRYGAGGVNAIAGQLGNKHNIAQNGTYQASMRSLQRTMNDNKDFAGFMRNKAPDAYQMISDGGMYYDKDGTKNMEYADLSWFSENNETATSIKDWATVSSATLARAVQHPKALSDEVIRSLLTSTDPAIQSGLQSESKKTDILKAALYNRQNPNSTLTGAAAAREYDKMQAQQAQQAQNSEEAARRASQAQAMKDALSNNVSEVRRYKPKIVGGNQRDITIRVMGDGRLLDENGNDVSGVDFDLYNRVD